MGAVEHGDLTGVQAIGCELLNLIDHECGLVAIIIGDVSHDGVSVAGVGPQPLLTPARVVRDQGVGRRQDGLGRAVVLLEHHDLSAREVLLELLDVAHVGTPERVDRLIGVADHAQFRLPKTLGAVADQAADQLVLGMVGVLILVDQYVGEQPVVVRGDLVEQRQHGDRVGDEIVEIHGPRALHPLGVHPVDVSQDLLGLPLGDERFMVDQLVLQVGDLVGQAPRLVLARVQVELFGDLREQPAGIIGVVDGERTRIPEVVGLPAQDAHTGAVERRDPHPASHRPDEVGHPFLHLVGGLVREGDRQDLRGNGLLGLQQVSDAPGQHPCLARSGASDDEDRPAPVGHGGGLLGVEVGDQV